MAVTKAPPPAPWPSLSRLAAACRSVLYPVAEAPATVPVTELPARPEPTARPGKSSALQAFCLSALTLPGLALADNGMPNAPGTGPNPQATSSTPASQSPLQSFSAGLAGDDDELDFQYSHYQEGRRSTYDITPYVTDNNLIMTTTGPYQFQNHLQPLTVDSEHAFSRLRIGDRTRLAFNYVQDVWSGATPWFDAPVGTFFLVGNEHSLTGATYWAAGAGQGQLFDAQGKPLYISALDGNTGTILGVAPSRIQHALGYASPEMRNQADFKVGYDWDNAALDVGAGVSVERDYLSRFGNVAGRMDFNQKRTTLNMGVSYTNSKTNATLNTGEGAYGGQVLDPNVNVSYRPTMTMQNGGTIYEEVIKGTRQDEAITLALSQVLSRNAVLSSGLGYTRSSGYLNNPYKDVMVFQLDPNWRTDGNITYPDTAFPGVQYSTSGGIVKEQRPNLRNQLTWDIGYRHYIEPLNAAGKLNYNFFHDDWGINAHTFDGEWRQALGNSWTLTPHARYYSQSAATFYTPYILLNNGTSDGSTNGNFSSLANQYFSSDQRLSSYGAMSTGVTLGKQLARGLSLELGYEYYTHRGALALGTGTANYADYHFYVANATLRVNLGQLALRGGSPDGYGLSDWLGNLFGGNGAAPADPHAGHHHGHAAAPAGVMFAHMLDQAGDMMFGYRYMRDTQGGDYQQGSQTVGAQQVLNSNACQPMTSQCTMLSTSMSMNMHMLDLMYAPTDWLNLMLMPQFVSMSMDMNMPVPMSMTGMGGMLNPALRDFQSSGGFGDTGAYALFKLWNGSSQHLHLTQGISIPTGAINVRQSVPGGPTNYYSYGMQPGSGTWDYKASLTYTGAISDWFWGGQVSGTHRLRSGNGEGYRLGDVFQSTAWGGYQVFNWLSTTVRGVYTGQGKIVGTHTNDLTVNGVFMWMPEDSPVNYGGSFVDVGFGVTASVPSGMLAGHSLGFEWLQPVSTNVQGYQLERTGALSATWNFKF